MRPITLVAPDVPDKTWKSAEGLVDAKKHAGNNDTINKKFAAFREEQIACLQAMGQPEAESKKWVEENWIGTYKGISGKIALFACPYAVFAMEKAGLLRVIPFVPDATWQSANMLVSPSKYIGDSTTMNKKLLSFMPEFDFICCSQAFAWNKIFI